MRRVAIYARVSTEDRGQDPENQLAQLRAWCIVLCRTCYRGGRPRPTPPLHRLALPPGTLCGAPALALACGLLSGTCTYN
jgi:hypothetical protein